MINMQTNTQMRAGFGRAKIGRISSSSFLKFVLNSLWSWRDPRQSLPDLTDRQARDIGLDPADLEWRRLRLPSRTMRHPML